MKISKDKIRAYALKNAISHKGKANPKAVISSLFAEGLKKDDIKETSKKISEIVKEINSLSLEEQKTDFEKFKDLVSQREIREGLPELPNTDKKVVMRFAPSASGPLHVIHALSASLNYSYVKKYKGKMIFRIEDTNPENVDPDSYDLLKQDAEFLFENKAKIFIQSDRMDLYYAYAVSLIEKGASYVCTCTPENFKEFSKNKKNCPCRKKSIKENILDWEKMLQKNGFKKGEAILRFKSGMQNSNPALRDFPLARINEAKHPRQKNKFRVWPLMNLSVAVDDIEMKLTHIIRGKDHRDNAKRQKMIFEIFKKEFPWTGFLGRYHFKDLEISTSGFRQGIKEGKYSGWSDPKLPTLLSLKKQGYKKETFWKMAEHIGLSEVDKSLDKKEFFRLLDMFNKE